MQSNLQNNFKKKRMSRPRGRNIPTQAKSDVSLMNATNSMSSRSICKMVDTGCQTKLTLRALKEKSETTISVNGHRTTIATQTAPMRPKEL